MALFWNAAPATASPEITLQPGQTFMPPSGWYHYKPGRYSALQRYDPRAQVWRIAGDDSNADRFTYFDGQTARIANITGCPAGAVVTTSGSGYTSVPAVTPSAGASTWTAILGGAISTLAVIGTAGGGYQYPPVLWIEQPPQPGAQATGYTTIANGTLSAVTIDCQGGGYSFPPNVEIVNDWRDTVGGGATVSLSLTGAGTVTGVLCNNHGNPITSGTVPTLAFGSGAAAATVVMDWSISSVSITTAGAGYATSGAVTASGAGGYVNNTPAYLGGISSVGMTRWREAKIFLATNSGGGLSAVNTIIDAGHYQAIPTPTIDSSAPPTTTGVLAFTMGGVVTTVFLMPAQQ